MRAIVLSGGGAKGAYQIGAWKALRKLHIHYDIVTGTSVGALNGAFLVQNDYERAKDMWEHINFNLIFSQQFNEKVLEENGTFELLKTYLKGILKSGGMDVSRMEETMDQFISTKKFYESKVDFGMITVNLSTLKPIEITKKEIPKKQLRDFLMASATCFPAFKVKRINGQMYIDGGYYDNLPINLAIKMGATDVIAIDLDAIGLKRKVENENIPITYIAPHNDLGNFLVFDESIAKRAICYGFNDTMKVFGKLDGNVFTFKRYHLSYNYLKYGKKMKKNIQELYLNKNDFLKGIRKSNLLTKFLNENDKKQVLEIQLEILEYLGKILELDDSVIYSVVNFNHLLKQSFSKVENLNLSMIENQIREKRFKELSYDKYFIRYFYELSLESKKDEKSKEKLNSLSLLFPKECLASFYLFTILS